MLYNDNGYWHSVFLLNLLVIVSLLMINEISLLSKSSGILSNINVFAPAVNN